MLEIEQLGWLPKRYAVRDDRGSRGQWTRRPFKETVTGEIDGRQYELRKAGHKHFFLSQAGQVLATADSDRRGRWTLTFGDSVYELRNQSFWHHAMELRRGQEAVGSIRRGKTGLPFLLVRMVICDLLP